MRTTLPRLFLPLSIAAALVVAACAPSPATTGADVTAPGGDTKPTLTSTTSAEGAVPAGPRHHELSDLVPANPAGLTYNAKSSADLSSRTFREYALESWSGAAGCDPGFLPDTSEYLDANFYLKSGPPGSVGVFLFRLSDPTAATAALDACNATATWPLTAETAKGVPYFRAEPRDGPAFVAIVGDVLIFVSGDSHTSDLSAQVAEAVVEQAAS